MTMTWLTIFCLILPALVSAQIKVQVKGTVDSNPNDLLIELMGTQVDIISDTERNTFKMTDSALKTGAEKYFGRPTDLYIKSPTPWGDLYQSYGWNQVQRTLTPIRAKVLQITSQPAIVVTQVFENKSHKTGVYAVGITQDVQNTASSSWSKGGELTVGSEISYELDFEIGTVGASMSLSYSSSWGKEVSKSETITFGSSSSVEVTLEPGESVTSQLEATKGSMQIEVEYEASLTGQAACSYNEVFRGHHFWGLDIRAVMSKADLSTTRKSKEVITVGFFSNAKIVVYDTVSVKRKLEHVAVGKTKKNQLKRLRPSEATVAAAAIPFPLVVKAEEAPTPAEAGEATTTAKATAK